MLQSNHKYQVGNGFNSSLTGKRSQVGQSPWSHHNFIYVLVSLTTSISNSVPQGQIKPTGWVPSHSTNGPFSSKCCRFSAMRQLPRCFPWALLFCIWEVLTKEGDWWEEFMFSAHYQVTRAYRCQHYCSTLEFLALLLSSTLAGFFVTFEFKSRALPRERVWLNQKLLNWPEAKARVEDSSKLWWWKPVERRNSQPIKHKQTNNHPPHHTFLQLLFVFVH